MEIKYYDHKKKIVCTIIEQDKEVFFNALECLRKNGWVEKNSIWMKYN